MQFYRRLAPFKAISFDLDDTLYHNYPVMMATDAKMIAYFRRLLPRVTFDCDYRFWFQYRQQALVNLPKLKHDVGALRFESYLLGLSALGFSADDAKKMAQQALDYFIVQRSDFTVPDEVHHLLTQLQRHWPLIAISNGNVDTQSIGIHHYFSAIYHAGNGLKQKPASDMFQQACQQFNLLPEHLLHVGDCGANDVIGAIRHGCQTAWVSTYDVGKPLRVLPTLALSDVTELQRLI
ncbi:haloacid dehalogenase [Thalassotalea insulae]|uniref:Haloacid dehalogenase n=1 Tax=Thalassotalea insulae TaxID=2056778 RepID=A0ABQ6GUS5_9GAMM|nr:HAD-IA family hydrolase [Thalassotalea insulae]GLX78421.1 haloacid dehalogenase [Thalassotalea insulae]